MAAGVELGAVAVVLGMLLVPLAWLPRIEVGPDALHYRGLGRRRDVALDAVTAVQLRRVPLWRSHAPHRSYRIGRLSTTPIRLRVLCGPDRAAQLTVVWWDDWPRLVRLLMGLGHVASDSHTRSRLDHYG
jgi:hypothetical protein